MDYGFRIGRGRLAGLVVALATLLPIAAGAATFTVNSNDDDSDQTPGDGSCFTGTFIILPGPAFASECTLRAAMEEANALAGHDTVNFSGSLPKIAGVVEFTPTTALPWILDPIMIDGYSHPDYDQANANETPVINILGTSVPAASTNGLALLPGSRA